MCHAPTNSDANLSVILYRLLSFCWLAYPIHKIKRTPFVVCWPCLASNYSWNYVKCTQCTPPSKDTICLVAQMLVYCPDCSKMGLVFLQLAHDTYLNIYFSIYLFSIYRAFQQAWRLATKTETPCYATLPWFPHLAVYRTLFGTNRIGAREVQGPIEKEKPQTF